jgi:hypothetical protein
MSAINLSFISNFNERLRKDTEKDNIRALQHLSANPISRMISFVTIFFICHDSIHFINKTEFD